MKQGALFFDETADRYDIRFDLADYYGGLHCGECLEVFTGGKWYFIWRLIATWRPRLEASHLCYTSDVQDQR